MSSRVGRSGARHLRPIVVLIALAGLFLLTLAAPCPHGGSTADGTHPVTSSAAVSVDESCSAASDALGDMARTVEGWRLDDGSNAVTRVPPADEPVAAGRHSLDVVGDTDPPHGRSLLVLLGIERK